MAPLISVRLLLLHSLRCNQQLCARYSVSCAWSCHRKTPVTSLSWKQTPLSKQTNCAVYRLYSSERRYEIVDDTEDENDDVKAFKLIFSHARLLHVQNLNFIFTTLALNFTFVLSIALTYDALFGHLTLNESLKEFVLFTVAALSTHVVMATRKPVLEIHMSPISKKVKLGYLRYFGVKKYSTVDFSSIVYKKGLRNADLIQIKGKKESWLIFFGHDSEKLRQSVRRQFKVRWFET